MSFNSFGHMFRVTTFGESHGPALGCVVDGCPPGIPLTVADIQKDLDRRRPGTSKFVTQRREPDTVTPLACPVSARGPALGMFEGTRYGTAEDRVAPGDILFFLTDGLCEIFNAKGDEFGELKVAQAIHNRREQPLKPLMEGVVNEARDFAANLAFDDDVCFLGMEILQLDNPAVK